MKANRTTFILLMLFPIAVAVLGRRSGDVVGLLWNGVTTLFWLFVPCADPLYGNRRQLFWVRQTIIVTAVALAFLIRFL